MPLIKSPNRSLVTLVAVCLAAVVSLCLLAHGLGNIAGAIAVDSAPPAAGYPQAQSTPTPEPPPPPVSPGVREQQELWFEHIPLEQGLSPYVFAILQDQRGFIWLGTRGGLYRYDGYGFETFKHDRQDPSSLSGYVVTSLCEDRDRALWIGTSGGLSRLDESTEILKNYHHSPDAPQSLSSDVVSSLYQDRDGVLWVGTADGGLDRFDRDSESFTHYRHDPNDPHSLSSDEVLSIYGDSAGGLWVGTQDGLNQLDQAAGTFTRYQHDPDDPHSLSHNQVQAIAEDGSGALWVGTFAGGLNKLDRATGEFAHYRHGPNDPGSLSNDAVWTLYTDERGTLWAGTNGGLDRLDRDGDTFLHYRHDPCSTGSLSFDQVSSIYQSRDGLLWVGTFGGGIDKSTVLYPEQGSPPIPQIAITRFSKFNQVVTTYLSPGEHIQLSYRDTLISFEFSVLDYAQPEFNRYAYILEGQDRTWIYPRDRRPVDYTNLGGGDYVFRVKGASSDRVWNDEGVAVYITVTPPFWETWWFRGIVVLVLVGSALGGYRLRVRSLEARSRELERQVEQRTAELRQEMEQRKLAEAALAQHAAEAAVAAERSRLAHELHDAVSQTLFSASLIAEVLPRLWERKQEEGRRRLEQLRRLARGAQAEMRMLLFELRPAALVDAELEGLLKQLTDSFSGKTGVPVTLEVEGECALPPDVQVAVYRIAQEALNNAAKHAQASQVQAGLHCRPDQVALSISDDGRGFDVARIPAGHFGVGIMHERAAAIGATLTVESEVGHGTRVEVVWTASIRGDAP